MPTMFEWLRRIPADLEWTEDAGSHANLKIGKLAHEAADEIERLRAALARVTWAKDIEEAHATARVALAQAHK